MPFLSREFLYSIRFKVLASLFPLLAFSIGISLYGIWNYANDRYVEIGRAEAMRAARTVEKALRASMLRNDREAIRQAVEDIYSIVKPSNISIIANDGNVAFSSDREMLGLILDRGREASCAVCHVRQGVIPLKDAIFIEKEGGVVLRNIIKIPNAPECQGCHPASEKNCGILLYDVAFGGIYAMLRTVAVRTFLTGLVTFLLVVAVLSLVINRFVHQPLQRLMEGFGRVGRGDYNFWVETGVRGELEEMGDQFNIMSRAIGRNVDVLRQKNAEIDTLYMFVREMSRTIEWAKVKKLVVNLLFETFHASQVMLVVPLRKKEGCYEISRREKGNRRYLQDEVCLEALDSPVPAGILADVERWRQGKVAEPLYLDNGSRVLIPLFSEGSGIGLICLQKEEGQRVSAAEQKLIVPLTSHVASSFANAHLYNIAVTDGLTGAYTKRYFQARLAELVGAWQQEAGRVFSLLMIDIDHFKEVNDTHGHPAGDEVLLQLARLLKKNLRYGEVFCRIGGEEFAILLPGLEEAAALATASRLRKEVAGYTFLCKGCPPLTKTVSIGVACLPLHATSGEELVKAADVALYEAKRAGRNLVRAYAPAYGEKTVIL